MNATYTALIALTILAILSQLGIITPHMALNLGMVTTSTCLAAHALHRMIRGQK